jgi:hypothetical protein
MNVLALVTPHSLKAAAVVRRPGMRFSPGGMLW